MKCFDRYGCPNNELSKICDEIHALVKSFVQDQFNNGLEPGEARAIDSYISNTVSCAVSDLILKHHTWKPQVGDTVVRMLAGTVPMELTITEITTDKIICGDWEFCGVTGQEIDDELGWRVGCTGSYIVRKLV